jgi:glycosyltransferase involved in cell wall biosynthesis
MEPQIMQMTQIKSPELSIVICTYNRHELLRLALNTLLQQLPANFACEVIVIDNNSTPETRSVVEGLAKSDSRIRYIRETRQGNAYARNTGVKEARAPVIAFLDDDVTVRQHWVEIIQRTFAEANVDFIGGKVLPRWEQPPPSWLSTTNWAPIAALDYGDEPFAITSENPLCLLTANIAFRKEVFEKHGGFSADVQRAGDNIGSLEDHEYLTRLFRAGVSGLYIPEMIVDAYVGIDRMTKTYHRRWHMGHGHFYAIMNDPEWERSSFRVAGVPGHLYRETAKNVLVWFSRMLNGNSDEAFVNECRLRFFQGFFKQRTRMSGPIGPNRRSKIAVQL